MNELTFMTATELGPLLQSRQISPVDLTTHFLNRIEEFDSTLHSYITPLPDFAIEQAKKAEDEMMRGNYKGPLHGIPIGIKDNYQTRGIRTTGGSKLFAEFIPRINATTVEKLLHAGVIMLGKQNMHEFGGGLTGTNPFFGTTRNPWNINYSPGASSSGASASLAGGLATLATGTDTFGSIRVPAAMSGIYGLKPTYGLVSTYGLFPLAWSLDTAGPMARSVSDLALMLQTMAGYDPQDPASLNVPIPNYTDKLDKDIKDLKIGIPTHYLKGLDQDVEILFQRAVTTMKNLGTEVKEIELPELTLSTFSGYTILSGEGSTYHYESLQKDPEDFAQDVRSLLLAGTLTNTPKYVRAQQARRKMVKAFDDAFQDVDIMLGPTIPIATPPFRENWVEQNLHVMERSMPFTVPINLTGVPSLAVPMGLDHRGLPVGMQLIGKHLSEKQLLQVGRAWEKTEPLTNSLKRT